ncbi:MAG TPA: endonuclease/exonuclease/phosphatase family protein [Candidatus Limnocylindrales bacterium]|nr:endonuclease/exonuclease/phosphatase family protein [Candidatus Limnocylindrales bacterium]
MIGEVTFGIIGLLFLFADVRTFASTFQQSFFGTSNTTLAIMAVSVFATSFLALLVGWRLGPRRALGASAAIFAVATFLCTTSRNNVIDLALSVIALAAGFWWLAFLHSARTADMESPLARALPVALALDLALRAVFRTIPVVDLAWPAAVGIVLVGALVFIAAGLTAMPPQRQWMAPGLRGVIGLLITPLVFLVAETGGTNGAQAAIAAGLGLGPEQARATQIGQLSVGLGLAIAALSLMRYPARGLVAAVGVAIGGALLWLHIPLVSVVGAGILGGGVLLAGATLLSAPLRPARSAALVILPLSFGWIVFVALAFGFYAFWAYQPAVYAAIALVAVAAAVAPPSLIRIGRPLAIATAALALAGPLVAFLSTPALADAVPSRVTFRFMTSNIHQGFDAGQVPSLDAIVATIDHELPDVVCLQEVVRGWMIDEGHDTLSVIAERLGMRYVWMPNIGDLYGNAVLSRFPMSDVKQVHYAIEPGIRHQPRGVLFVRVADVLVGCTHLDELSDGTFVRQEQVRTIIREIGDTSPVIIAGDLNATPEDIEIRLLNEFGLDDLGAAAGVTTTGDDPQSGSTTSGRAVWSARKRTRSSSKMRSRHRTIDP